MIAATLGHRGMLTARFGSTRSLLTKLHMAAARWPGCLLRFVILDWTSNYPCETTQQKSRTGKAERITIMVVMVVRGSAGLIVADGLFPIIQYK